MQSTANRFKDSPRFFAYALMFFLAPASVFAQPGALHLNDADLSFHGDSFPDSLPLLFFYPESRIVIEGSSRNRSFFGGKEGAVLLNTEDPAEKVSEYYNQSLAADGWRIIQSKKIEGRILLMAESPFRKIVTVIISRQKPTEIKIYYKNSGTD